MSKPDEWMDLDDFANVSESTRPAEQVFRWKLAALSGEWDATFRVTLPKKNDEDDQEERDEK